MEQTPSQAEVGEGGETKSVHPSQYSRMPQEQPTSQNVAAGKSGPGLMGWSEVKQKGFLKECAAECIGAFFLVFIGCGSCTVAGGNHVAIALCFGITVFALIHAIGHVSGAHLNPAVSIGLVAAGYCGLMKALFFILAQCVGGIIGALFLWLVVGWHARETLGQTVVGFAHRGHYSDSGWLMMEYMQAILIEMLITYFLVLVVCGVCDKQKSDAKGSAGILAIGLSIVGCHLFAIPLTGASMNSARTLGPNLVSWINYQATNYTLADTTAGLTVGAFSNNRQGRGQTADQWGRPPKDPNARQLPLPGSQYPTPEELKIFYDEAWSVPGNAPMADLWVYLLAPNLGGLLAGLTYRFLFREKPKPQENQ